MGLKMPVMAVYACACACACTLALTLVAFNALWLSMLSLSCEQSTHPRCHPAATLLSPASLMPHQTKPQRDPGRERGGEREKGGGVCLGLTPRLGSGESPALRLLAPLRFFVQQRRALGHRAHGVNANDQERFCGRGDNTTPTLSVTTTRPRILLTSPLPLTPSAFPLTLTGLLVGD